MEHLRPGRGLRVPPRGRVLQELLLAGPGVPGFDVVVVAVNVARGFPSVCEAMAGGYYFVALPYPEGRIDRVLALVTEVPNLEIFRSGISPFAFRGLTGNGNLTGNFLAPCLAFVVRSWRPAGGTQGVRLFFIVAARSSWPPPS